jgi:hypothetical protein
MKKGVDAAPLICYKGYINKERQMTTLKMMGWNVALYDDGLYKYVEAIVETKSEKHHNRLLERINNKDNEFNLLAYAEVIEIASVHQKDTWVDEDDKDYAYGCWELADRPFEML